MRIRSLLEKHTIEDLFTAIYTVVEGASVKWV